jgi:hypothetical protein
MRTFEEINEILTNLPTDVYFLTGKASQEYYAHGNTELLQEAVEKSGLTEDEILCMW